jgi:hypothetical protein
MIILADEGFCDTAAFLASRALIYNNMELAKQKSKWFKRFGYLPSKLIQHEDMRTFSLKVSSMER